MSFLLGVTRSRTLLYFSYRDSAPKKSSNQNYTTTLEDDEGEGDNDERRGLIPKDSTIIDMTSRTAESQSPPKWCASFTVKFPHRWSRVDISEQVEQILTTLHPKISTLDKLHAKHVLPGFTDRSAEEREIQSITNDITHDFRRCQALIQKISTSDSSSHTFPPKPGPATTLNGPAQNVQRALAAKVQELSRLQGHSIKNQDLLLASGQVRLRGQESISALEDDVRASQSTTTPIPSSPSQTLISMQTQDTSSSITQHRNQEIAEIATSITQLAELFKDLSTLVIDQGTILDSVEYNIEQTAVHLDHAHEDLIVGEK
ncbi:hypothetical protein Clacol_000295 [Clathrus columnatus]|uniref:t-SNARE coiled-coil homology domain-containing protein n=1 Tax=Clathrus columnatus TaxID=1419009 RepID=A0AAV4ZWD6_9AGAM|nr:hypothetical protein Clacol_000295 [Clathrus columnatus]